MNKLFGAQWRIGKSIEYEYPDAHTNDYPYLPLSLHYTLCLYVDRKANQRLVLASKVVQDKYKREEIVIAIRLSTQNPGAQG